MKSYLIFGIYLFLVKYKSVTAKNIASNFEISERSVYRYIDELSIIGIPVVTKRGKNGGIELMNSYFIDSLTLSKNDKEIIKKFVYNDENKNIVKEILKKLI